MVSGVRYVGVEPLTNPFNPRPRRVGGLVVTNCGAGGVAVAMSLDSIRNKPVLPPVVPDTGAAEYGSQNAPAVPPPPPPPLEAHATATFVTSAEPTVPDPSLIVQVSPVGCADTVTA